MSNNKAVKYYVCVVDISDGSEYQPHILKAFDAYTEAQDFVKKDLEYYVADSEGMEMEANYDGMRAWSDRGYGCQYSIEKFAIELS